MLQSMHSFIVVIAVRPLCLLPLSALGPSVPPPPTFRALTALLVTPACRAGDFAVGLERCYHAAAVPAADVAFISARRAAKSNIGAMCHLHEANDSALVDCSHLPPGVVDVKRVDVATRKAAVKCLIALFLR